MQPTYARYLLNHDKGKKNGSSPCLVRDERRGEHVRHEREHGTREADRVLERDEAAVGP